MDRNAVILFSDEQNIIIDDFWQGHDWQVAIFIYLFIFLVFGKSLCFGKFKCFENFFKFVKCLRNSRQMLGSSAQVANQSVTLKKNSMTFLSWSF